MNDEFAIEPTAFENAMQLKYVLEKFGFHQGRFIVGLPSKWVKQVHEHILKFPELEQARARRLLERVKNAVIKPGDLGFESSLAWIDNAHRISQSIPLRGIIATSKNSFGYPTPEDVDDDFFGSSFDVRIVGSTENYAKITRHLLQASQEIVIVDPYLKLLNSDRESVIKRFLLIAQKGSTAKQFVFWTKDNDACDKGYDRMLRDKYLSCLELKSTLTVKLVDDGNSNEKIHARLLLSALGGFRFDHGFQDFKDGRQVDISLVTKQAHDAHCKWYLDPNSRNDFVTLESYVVGFG